MTLASPKKDKLNSCENVSHQTPRKTRDQAALSPALSTSPITPARKKSSLGTSLTERASTQSFPRKKILFGKENAKPDIETVHKSANEDELKQLKTLYSLIRKKTGSLGGAGSGGAIYGEITQESFQRVVQSLVTHCGLCSESQFMDIGAGLGKPNFHVAIYPGVKLSYGIELIGGRWWQSLGLLQSCVEHKSLKHLAQNVFFAHANVMDLTTFDPITHVYSFNRGFPPDAMRYIAKLLHASKTAQYFICFDKPSVLAKFDFKLELIEYVSTKMAGSGEQHRCFIYRKKDDENVNHHQVVAIPKIQLSPSVSPIRTRRSRRHNAPDAKIDKNTSPSNIRTNPTTSYSKVESKQIDLVLPPQEVELAPHVPHSKIYTRGIEYMQRSREDYLSWIYEEIGLNRCERTTRTRRTRTTLN